MEGIRKLREILDRLLGAVTVFLFVLMTVVGSYQIITRYFFNRPSTVSEELLTYSFTWMSLLAASYVFGRRDHMRMSFLADKITGKSREILEIGIEALVFLFAGIVMLYGGIRITRLTMSQVTASLQIPMGYVYLAIPLSGALIMIYNVMNIVEMIREKEGV